VLTKASAVPFDCGLYAGVVIGMRCSRSAVQIVSSAVKIPSLSLNHWIGCGGPDPLKAS
jgi:hypothetical protein